MRNEDIGVYAYRLAECSVGGGTHATVSCFFGGGYSKLAQDKAHCGRAGHD